MDLEQLLRRAREGKPLPAILESGDERCRLRHSARWSQETMAAVVGCSKTAIQKYEEGQWTPHTLELAFRYRQALRLCEELSAGNNE